MGKTTENSKIELDLSSDFHRTFIGLSSDFRTQVTCGHVWSRVVTCGHVWSRVVTCGHVWSRVVTCGHVVKRFSLAKIPHYFNFPCLSSGTVTNAILYFPKPKRYVVPAKAWCAINACIRTTRGCTSIIFGTKQHVTPVLQRLRRQQEREKRSKRSRSTKQVHQRNSLTFI